MSLFIVYKNEYNKYVADIVNEGQKEIFISENAWRRGSYLYIKAVDRIEAVARGSEILLRRENPNHKRKSVRQFLKTPKIRKFND